MSKAESEGTTGLSPQYQTYERQKCFIAYTEQADWSDDLLSACQEVLSRPEFDLEPDYARQHFDPDPLRQKALKLIANARYGIYDLSYWRDENNQWQMPRNVFIELGMAIALNRPILLLRHANNQSLDLPGCLESVSGHILEFSGEITLRRALEKRLPQWIDAPPDRDWRNRFCIFGGRVCKYRKAHPQVKQLGQRSLYCHISDGPDVDRPDFRGVVEHVLRRFSDVTFDYLNALPIPSGYDFLICTYCQSVRSSPFAIYRITPHTPAETFITIGMSIALETQFKYKIPKILLTDGVQDVPSLLSGYQVVTARSDKKRKAELRKFIPTVIRMVEATTWKSRPLPFVDRAVLVEEPPQESEGFQETPAYAAKWGFRLDPFAYPEAEAMPFSALEETFIALPEFERHMMDLNRSTVCLAPLGGGKTASRLHLEARLRLRAQRAVDIASPQGSSPLKLLPVTYNHFGGLVRFLPVSGLQDHIEPLLGAIAEALLEFITMYPQTFVTLDERGRDWYWAFLETYLGGEVLTIRLDRLQAHRVLQDWQRTTERPAPVHPSSSLEVILQALQTRLTAVGFNGLCILADGFGGYPETQSSVNLEALVAPLLNTLPILSLQGVVWKIFLPDILDNIVRSSAGYQTGRVNVIHLNWDESSLRDLLQLRLSWASDGLIREIAQLCSEDLRRAVDVEGELVRLALQHRLGPPRALLYFTGELLQGLIERQKTEGLSLEEWNDLEKRISYESA